MPASRSSFKKKRIRSFFLSMEIAEKGKEEVEKIQDQIEEKGLSYIQMKLPVVKITPEFEAQLQEKVDKNILHAKIREANEQDLPSVMQVYNRAWMTSNTPFSPINLESLKQIYDFQDTIILLAQVYGSDAGFIILDFEGPNKEYGIIAGLGVIPRFQRKGLGKMLGMAAWNYLKKKGIKELHCEVFVDNKGSYNFIKSIGFEEFDTKTYRMEEFRL